MTTILNRWGHQINRKRVQRLMQKMGLEAIYPRPRTSRPAPQQRIYPYLTAGAGDRPAQSGVEHRHHLRADATGLYVSGGRDGLV